MKKKAPAGLLIFGWVNTVLLGIIPAVLFLSIIFFLPAESADEIWQLLQEKGVFLPAENREEFGMILKVQGFMAAMFIASGAGILRQKEWGRRFTVYFSFFLLILVLVSIVSAPAALRHLVFNIFYPGALVLYFTNQRIGEYFR